MDDTRSLRRRTILLAEYGSRAYGTATIRSDRDLMGVYVETEEQVHGLAETRTLQTDLGRRSGAGDTDETLHPLRKFVRLAAAGNPTVLSVLWVPAPLVAVFRPAGALLVGARDLFVTKQAGAAHLGYARSQRMAMTGERGNRTKRPELVERHGYDVKFGMHLIRLLLQGRELLDRGGYALPMPQPGLDLLRAIRAGEVPIDDLLRLADELEQRLGRAIEESSLPDRADPDAVDRLLIDVRREAVRDLDRSPIPSSEGSA